MGSMPTIRSTSADRSAIWALADTPWARIASVNWAPIDFTGLSAFIALCMTTDMSFQRTEASSRSVSPTMLTPLKITLPLATPAGGLSSWAIANSSVDLPQPDSPTMPMNSPGSRSKLTPSTARTVPRSVAYSTTRSRTASTAPEVSSAGAVPSTSLLRALDTVPPHAPDRPQGRVADLVERVVQQRERGAQRDDAQAGDEDPQGLAGLERLAVLGPVQHRAPAHHLGVAEPDELQAGGEQHRVQRVGQEGGHQQRGHRGDDLYGDDVQRALAPHPRGLEEFPVAQRAGLGAQLARGVGPRDADDDRDHHSGAGPVQVAGDDDQQRERRDDQQHVGDQVQHAVPGPAEVGGGHADQRGEERGAEAGPERDQQHRAGAVDHLGEQVLAERGRAQQVRARWTEAARVDLGTRVVVRDHPGEQPDQDEEREQRCARGGLAVGGDGAGHPPQRARPADPAAPAADQAGGRRRHRGAAAVVRAARAARAE